jgi:adenylate kinase family enzyme
MSLLLCFSGQIGSGKSSVSAEVAAKLGWSRTGFGDYLRAEILRRGGDTGGREALQDLGKYRVDENCEAFCRDVLAFGGFRPGQNFVIDGIRHVSVFDTLAVQGLPSRARLLFLGAQETIRVARVMTRADAHDFERAAKHSVEAELANAVPKRADGTVNTEQTFERVVSDCLNLVQGWL